MYNNSFFITKATLAVALVTLFCFFSCEKEKAPVPYAEAVLSGTKADITVTGTLRFYEQAKSGVRMELELVVPQKANSSVAVHLHEHGMCGNAGADAHGHWNPTGKKHGQWGIGEFHSGDIGNITLDENGKGKLILVSRLWTIGGPDSTNILNRGVIVHSGVDDYTSQPAGNSGPRIGCGVIQKKN